MLLGVSWLVIWDGQRLPKHRFVSVHLWRVCRLRFKNNIGKINGQNLHIVVVFFTNFVKKITGSITGPAIAGPTGPFTRP